MSLWTALLLGVLGGVHCAGMCGPLLLALPGQDLRWRFVCARIVYHACRVLTYSGLGVLSGMVGQALVFAGAQRWISIGFGALLLAGLVATRRWNLALPIIKSVGSLQRAMRACLQRRSLLAHGVLGALNGLLPCGLVYVACGGAAASGSAVHGALFMAAFGVGTWPMMLGLSLSGRAFPLAWRQRLVGALPVVIGLVATMLILRGLSLGIPFLSPTITGTMVGCPHCR